jgi:hypothetical protein
MKKICIALALLLMIAAQELRAVEEKTQSKSECQKLFESCKAASIKLPTEKLKNTVSPASLASLCEECKKKCSTKNQGICKEAVKENQKEIENFRGLNDYTLNCNQVCK